MVGIDSGFFLQLPGNSKQRVLHPAKVLGVADDVYTAEVEELDLAVEDGLDVLVYFDKCDGFMQRPARIETVDTIDATDETEPQLLISLTTTGPAVSAENRQQYRVSTVIMDLTAQFGPDSKCPVVDVSALGFSVIAPTQYDSGNVVSASMKYDDQTYAGEVSVQSVRELSKGRIRYGLLCADAKTSQDNLANGLRKMSVKIQREQLRRLAGAV
ncbi:MAG: hypothetical protein GY842_08825 [bacterium]|nr:hypothetical protein [bacterium]